jgi:hypothetical protein
MRIAIWLIALALLKKSGADGAGVGFIAVTVIIAGIFCFAQDIQEIRNLFK